MSNLIQVAKSANDKDRYATLITKIKHVKDFWNTNIGIMKDNISAIESIDPGDNFRNHLIASRSIMGDVQEKHVSQLDIWLDYMQFRIKILTEFDGRVQRVFESTINEVESEAPGSNQRRAKRIFDEDDFETFWKIRKWLMPC